MTLTAQGEPGASELLRLRARIAELEASERERAELLIENVRLREDAAVAEAHQASVALVMRAVESAAGDLQKFLDTVVEHARRACGATDAVLFVTRDDVVVATAHDGPLVSTARDNIGRPVGIQKAGEAGAQNPRDQVAWRAYVDRCTVEVADITEADASAEFPGTASVAARQGVRAYLASPLLRDGRAVGVLLLRRAAAGAFGARQTRLLETFASQAVIAIENASLFNELQQRLEEQTATAEVLASISHAPTNLQRVLDTITDSALRLCSGIGAALAYGPLEELQHISITGAGAAHMPVRARIEDRGAFPIVYATGEVFHSVDLREDERVGQFRARAAAVGMAAGLIAPLIAAGEVRGVLAVWRTEPRAFSERQIALIRSFADQAVIAIENARLFTELNDANATLKSALEQQTATSEVLRVIAASPSDLAASMSTLLQRVCALCGPTNGSVFLVRDQRFSAIARQVDDRLIPLSDGRQLNGVVSRESIIGLVALQKQPMVIADLQAIPVEDLPGGYVRRLGYRALALVPMLLHGECVGVIMLHRPEPDPYTPAQVALLETFAQQAAIAIENTRLFTELQERDARRRQELERAASIQQRLLPSLVEGWPGLLEIAHRFRPAVETSGDFFDVLPLPAAQKGALEPLQIAVGDVAGKGMAAALVTALARSALHSTAFLPSTAALPAATLRLAGQRLHRDVGSGHFVACALALVEPPGRHNAGPLLRLANAAQVPVLLVRNGQAQEIEPPGYRLPLGAEDDGAYEDARTVLIPGDVVVFSSDGLVEAPALPTAAPVEHLPPPEKPGALFGFARLATSASHWSSHTSTAEEVAHGIWSDLTAWCGEESHHDDMTLLVLRVPL